MSGNISDTRIVINAHADLQKYDLVYCEMTNNKNVLVTFSPSNTQKFELDKSNANLLKIDNHDAVLAILSEKTVVLFDPNKNYFLNNNVFIFKCELRDGVYDMRKKEELRRAYEILKNVNFNFKEIGVALEKHSSITIEYYHSLRTLKLQLSEHKDKDVYMYFKQMLDNRITTKIYISKNQLIDAANCFNHRDLKEFAEMVQKDILTFSAGRVSINGTTYIIIPDLKSNNILYTYIRFKDNICMLTMSKEDITSTMSTDILWHLGEVAEDLPNTFIYTPYLPKIPAGKFFSKIAKINPSHMLIVDNTVKKYLCVIRKNTQYGKFERIIEGKDNVILLTQSGTYVFNSKDFYQTSIIDPEDYEYLMQGNQ